MRPTDEHRERCRVEGLDLEGEFKRFCASTDARGVLYASWSAAFTTWLMNEAKWRKERGARPGQRPTDIRQRTPVGSFDYSKVMAKPTNGAAK